MNTVKNPPTGIRFTAEEIEKIKKFAEYQKMDLSPFIRFMILSIIDIVDTAVKAHDLDGFMICCKEMHDLFMNLVKKARNGQRG